MAVEEWFEVRDLERLTDLSASMVDYLCRTKIIAPSKTGSRGRGRGKARRFSFGDVVQLRTYAKLLKAGVSVKRLKEAHNTWQNHFRTLDYQTPPTDFLVTDGRSVYFKHTEQILEDLNGQGQLSFFFIVDLKKVHGEVAALLKKA